MKALQSAIAQRTLETRSGAAAPVLRLGDSPPRERGGVAGPVGRADGRAHREKERRAPFTGARPLPLSARARLPRALHDRNQVDPACSHTLVSKIKPCMFKHKYYKAKLRMAHYISYNILDSFSTWITVVILELIHDQRRTRAAFIRYNQPFRPWRVIITELTVFVRRFLLISALSAFDGRVLAYHGVNG